MTYAIRLIFVDGNTRTEGRFDTVRDAKAAGDAAYQSQMALACLLQDARYLVNATKAVRL